MKRSWLFVLLIIIISTTLILAFSLGSCKNVGTAKAEKLRIVFYIPATLGDKAWADDSHDGFDKAMEKLNIEGKFIEGGFDASKYESDLEQLSKGDWDVVITATPSIINEFILVAQNNPKQKYIYLDDYNTTDFSGDKFSNVLAVPFKQNEPSFLAGALAALVIPSDMPHTNHNEIIGFIGGMDVPPMKDFLVGYVQGAKYINPNIEVIESYANTFGDPAIGKELTLAQYDQGVNIVYAVAGLTGLGMLDAAKERNQYVIGVDADQAMLYKDTDLEKAKLILTSVLKYFGNTTYQIVEMLKNDEIVFGKSFPLGIKDNAVGIAKTDIYQEVVPDKIKDVISELEKKVKNGEIKVESAIGL